METNIISDGFILLVLGMGFVFLFLGLLVVAMNAMTAIINRFPTNETIARSNAVSSPAAPAAVSVDPNVLAAIRAAIAQHREK